MMRSWAPRPAASMYAAAEVYGAARRWATLSAPPGAEASGEAAAAPAVAAEATEAAPQPVAPPRVKQSPLEPSIRIDDYDLPHAPEDRVIVQKTREEKKAAAINKDRPLDIAEAGDGPVPLDFKAGEGTEIIDHHMDLAENFYKPATPVPLETILEHEAKREHLSIYRSKPEKLPQLWEGGIPRFVRAPLHMTFSPLESRNQEMAPGPVLHDTRTGIAIRVLGQMTPSPERVVQEDQLRDKLRIAAGRAAFWGWMFVFAFLFKFMAYMSLRTKLRTQGISNPILPQNRIKTLEIMWFARNNFKQYRAYFKEFSELHWIPYRQAQLAKDAAVGERDTKDLMLKLEAANIAASESDDGLWGSVKRLFGFGAKEESTMRTVFVKEMNESYEIDTSRAVIGMSPDGPVYATPDTEVLYPDQLKAKMASLKTKVTAQMDTDLKTWSAESYDKRARDHADEFVVQFHQFLRDKGVITPLDPATIDQMYDIQPIPRIQHLDNFDPEQNTAADGTAVRAQIVRVR
eukprot:Rhum_TRINITY_DN16835_c0_g1::Rhum_TRINITY_DN16835_c0_g1_i1::g.164446::m.164446